VKEATPVWLYIAAEHGHNITHAAKALGYDRSTLHRVMDSAYVINGVLYTKARTSK
jgi:transcriptional regulator of acetoin/glycerol metabolism